MIDDLGPTRLNSRCNDALQYAYASNKTSSDCSRYLFSTEEHKTDPHLRDVGEDKEKAEHIILFMDRVMSIFIVNFSCTITFQVKYQIVKDIRQNLVDKMASEKGRK